MKNQQQVWNEVFKNIPLKTPKTDDWLEKYMFILKKHKHKLIVDLGCGFGNDSYYLSQRGFKTLACDFSQEALNRINTFMEKANVKLVDMQKPLPFQDGSVAIIISDLSLHYFSEKTTYAILKELKRVLIKDGAVICRVNSLKELEKNLKDSVGKKIEDNYYLIANKLKRYFNKDDVHKYFADFNIGEIYSYIMSRYNFDKQVLDFIALKK